MQVVLGVLMIMAVGQVGWGYLRSKFAAHRTTRATQPSAWRGWLTVHTGLSLTALVMQVIDRTAPHHEMILPGSQWSLVYWDGVTAVMHALVSLVGWVVVNYSYRYMAGEPQEKDYYSHLILTLGALQCMTLAGNLLLFLAAWIVAGWSLNRLLQFYGNRPQAIRGARQKFWVDRIGDGILGVGLLFVYQQFETLNWSGILASGNDWLAQEEWNWGNTAWLSFFLIVGAAIKSVQFPFHFWLPETLDAPTPVSALMHAGVINAGGYLLVRSSPVIEGTPAASALLVLVGSSTCILAGLSMLTQTSIKKSLAYSTVAQMGFMMLQMGLGAYVAAMAHIVAHALYKSYAFLNSGDVLQESRNDGAISENRIQPWKVRFLALAIVLALVGAEGLLTGHALIAKPGGLLLGVVLMVGLVRRLEGILQPIHRSSVTWGVITTAGLVLTYEGAYWAMDLLLANSVPEVEWTRWTWVAAGLASGGLLTLLGLERLIRQGTTPSWLNRLYVHASHGFYFEAWMGRWGNENFVRLAALQNAVGPADLNPRNLTRPNLEGEQ